jgi:hypothetical protein
VVDGWLRLIETRTGQRLSFMQGGASAHSARGTIQDLQEQGVICVRWPAYSPDLNPIEMVWNWMKDWIQERYEDTLHGYDQLRAAVAEAWAAVPEAYLEELLATMRARCQAVILAHGKHTRY